MNNSPVILMINDHIHFGGGGDATFRHEREIFEKAGFDVYTFSHGTKPNPDKSDKDIVHLASKNKRIQRLGKYTFNPFVYFRLKKLLKKIKPGFVHLHLPSKYPAPIFAALRGWPVAHTLHGPGLFCATGWGCLKKDSSFCELGVGWKCYVRGCVPLSQVFLCWFLYRLSRFFARRAVKLFIGPSRQICRVAEQVGFGPAEYIPLCMDKQFCVEPKKVDKNPPSIIYVGALSEQKGVDLLLDAFEIVLKKVPNARLKYAGRGKMLSILQTKAKKMGIKKNVDFLGFVDHDSINRIYYESSVFVLPSIWSEQFGLVGPEALACGLPCVASDIGGIPEWLKDSEWGYLVPPRDINVLAGKIVKLLENKQLSEEFGREGRKFVLDEYSTLKFKENMLVLVERFIKCG